MPTIVLAPDSFKESLTAQQVCDALERGLRARLGDVVVRRVPMADGGEGTVRALVDATGGQLRRTVVTGPLGDPVAATWGILGGATDTGESDDAGGRVLDRVAVIEVAEAAGLGLVPPDHRDPRRATTRGVGELLLAALDEGCREVVLGLGGSATNDGGAGMMQALGARLLDADGRELPPGGAALARLHHIDATGIDPRQATVQVACDVTNPLCGPHGASAVYGPQKGADAAATGELDAALARFARVVERDLGRDVADVPGAGAAGGLGAGLLALFPHALLRPGVEIVMDHARLFEALLGADLVVTGEGRLDSQTRCGKTPMGVARFAGYAGVPCVAVAGVLGDGWESLYDQGFAAIIPVVDRLADLDETLARATTNLERTGSTIGALIALGGAVGPTA